MTTVLYLLIAVLILFVVGYIWVKTGCTSGERYLSETPVDPVSADDGSCEDDEILAAQKEAREAEDAKMTLETETKEEEAAARAEEVSRREVKEEVSDETEAAKKVETTGKVKRAKEVEPAEEAVSEEKNGLGAKNETEAAKPEETDTAAPASMAPEGLLDAPKDGKKDNLTKIKGIGVKIDEALNSIGIYHFYQIAAWTEENMAWADGALAFPGRAKRDDWVGQAKALAEGKETEFSKRVEKGEVASSKKA